MAVYATAADVQAEVPFTLDANSKPTLTEAGLIQATAYGLINDKIGGAGTDLGGLKALEIKITVEKIKAVHERRSENLREIWLEFRDVIDNYRSDKGDMVSIGDLKFGRNDDY